MLLHLCLMTKLFVRPVFSENQLENETQVRLQDPSTDENYNDYDDIDMDFVNPQMWIWCFIVLNILVLFVGLFGNFLVCAAVYRNHSMRTVTNYLLVNLAIADFLVILFCLMPTLIWDVTMSWLLGNTLCKVVLYLQIPIEEVFSQKPEIKLPTLGGKHQEELTFHKKTVSVTVSVLTLTFISVDRWYAICHPLKFKSSTRRTKTFILVIWIVAFILDIPEIIVYENVPPNVDIGRYFTSCDPQWSAETETSWQLGKVLVLYVIPVTFMTVTYAQIINVLWHSGNVAYRIAETVGAQTHLNFAMANNTSTRAQLRSRKKAAKMLVAVVVMFAFCFFPTHLLTVMRSVMFIKNGNLERACSFTFHLLIYINSAVNPLIYNFMNTKFRKEFRYFFRCCYSARTRTRTIFNMIPACRSTRNTSSLVKSRTACDSVKNKSNGTNSSQT